MNKTIHHFFRFDFILMRILSDNIEIEVGPRHIELGMVRSCNIDGCPRIGVLDGVDHLVDDALCLVVPDLQLHLEPPEIDHYLLVQNLREVVKRDVLVVFVSSEHEALLAFVVQDHLALVSTISSLFDILCVEICCFFLDLFILLRNNFDISLFRCYFFVK